MGFSQKKHGRPSHKAIKERKRRKLQRVLLILNHLHKLEVDSVDFLLIMREKSANAYKKVKYVGTGDLRDKFECGQPIFGAETRLYRMGLKGIDVKETPTQSHGSYGLKFFSECTTIGKTKDKCKEAKLGRDKSKVASIQSKSTSTSDEKKTTSELQLTDSSTSTLTGTTSVATTVKTVKVSIKKTPKKQGTAWVWRTSQCDGKSGEESDYTLNSEEEEDNYSDLDLDDDSDMFSDDDVKGDLNRDLVEKVIRDLGNTTERQDECTAVEKTNQQQHMPPDQSRQDVMEDDELTELSSTATASADKTKNLLVVLNTENDNDNGGQSGPATDEHFENAETNNHTKAKPLTPEQQDVIENAVKTSSQQCPAVFAYEQGTWWVVQNASSGQFMLKSTDFDESTKKIATPKLLVSSQEMPTIISKDVAPRQVTEESEQVKSKEENATNQAATTRGDNSSMQPYILRKSTRKRAYRKLIEYTPSKKKSTAENKTMQHSCDQNSKDHSSSSKLLSTTGEESVTKSQLHMKVPSLNINLDVNTSTSQCTSVQSSPQLDCSTSSHPSSTVQQVKDVMFMMNQFMSIQQQQFQEELDHRERMHLDRMSVFKGLVDTLKVSVEKDGK